MYDLTQHVRFTIERKLLHVEYIRQGTLTFSRS